MTIALSHIVDSAQLFAILNVRLDHLRPDNRIHRRACFRILSAPSCRTRSQRAHAGLMTSRSASTGVVSMSVEQTDEKMASIVLVRQVGNGVTLRSGRLVEAVGLSGGLLRRLKIQRP